MTKHWITAAKALAIVAEHSSPTSARIGLCSRAHADLVETKAKLVTVGGRGHEDSPVPADFWWADGGAALDQDWAVGDFSTWLNRKVECKAFGVLFDLEGVLAMIPAQRRGDHRLSLSVAGDPAWLTAHQAGQRLGSSAGLADGKARTALIDNCRLGFVSARAVLMQRSDAGRPGEWSLEEREWDVPAWFWSNFIDLEVEDWNDWNDSPHNWHRGVFAGQGDSPTGACWVALTGTHFHVEALQALYPSGGGNQVLPAVHPPIPDRLPVEDLRLPSGMTCGVRYGVKFIGAI